MKKWIDEASYTGLLRKWRFAEAGSPFFVGEMGSYYAKVMEEKKNKLSSEEQVSISKFIGWSKK
jgi:hypothetical protein